MTITSDPSGLIREELLGLEGYQSGVPWQRIIDELGLVEADVVKLDSNENPYGPAPLVRDRLAAAPLHLYPDMDQHAVRRALAAYIGVAAENIVGGNGSDELIDLLMRLFCAPGDEVITAPPTFAMYEIYARLQGLTVVEAPRRPADWALDLAALEAAITPRTKMIVLAAPNNPTGNAISRSDLDHLLSVGPVVVIDEAYAEFADEQFAPLAAHHPNLVVLRTFSKWGGLAGVRAGYLVADHKVVDRLLVMKSPFNMSLTAQIAIVASLEQRDWLDANAARIRDERERLFTVLAETRLLQPWPSQGNFLLCRVPGSDGRTARDALRRHGVFTRHFATSELSDCLRITVGRPEDSDRLLAALSELKADWS